MPCKNCKYSFHKLVNYMSSLEIGILITLVKNEDNKTVAQMRISETANAICIDFIMSFEERKGYGSRLMRLVQAMAKKHNKPIHINAICGSIGFFEKFGFTVDNPKERWEELVLMTWKP